MLDESGYVPSPRDSAQLVFAMICARYEPASFVVTSNLNFSRWAEVVASEG